MSAPLEHHTQPGITWLRDGILHVDVNSDRPVEKSLLALPADYINNGGYSVSIILQAIEQVYQHGYEQHASIETELNGIVVGGGGDPLLSLDILLEVVFTFKVQRHGVPVSIVTFGLVESELQTSVVEQLLDAGIEGAMVYLPAATPVEYGRICAVEAAFFGLVCQFIETAASAGLKVTTYAHRGDNPSSRDIRALALALGAIDFIVIEGTM